MPILCLIGFRHKNFSLYFLPGVKYKLPMHVAPRKVSKCQKEHSLVGTLDWGELLASNHNWMAVSYQYFAQAFFAPWRVICGFRMIVWYIVTLQLPTEFYITRCSGCVSKMTIPCIVSLSGRFTPHTQTGCVGEDVRGWDSGGSPIPYRGAGGCPEGLGYCDHYAYHRIGIMPITGWW